jgi:hypothetical protein
MLYNLKLLRCMHNSHVNVNQYQQLANLWIREYTHNVRNQNVFDVPLTMS